MTTLSERVKAILDAECFEKGWYRCPERHFTGKDCKPGHKPHTCSVECWQCHQNDLLADKIADLFSVKV